MVPLDENLLVVGVITELILPIVLTEGGGLVGGEPD